MKFNVSTALSVVLLAVTSNSLLGCASSSEVEALREQVKELQARLAYAQQSALEANRIAVQAAQTANDARMATIGNKPTAEKKEVTSSTNISSSTVARATKFVKVKAPAKQG